MPVEKVFQRAGHRDVLRGKLTRRASLAAVGRSQADLVASLSGTVESDLKDGAIVGFDIRRAMRPFTDRAYDPRNTTPFDRLSGSFAISDGVARSDSIQLEGPAVRISANGSADLKTSGIDFRSRISLVPPPSGFTVPLKFVGSWNRLQTSIDWGAFTTQWSGEPPFGDLEVRRKAAPSLLDPELIGLIRELFAQKPGQAIPAAGVNVLREMSGR